MRALIGLLCVAALLGFAWSRPALVQQWTGIDVSKYLPGSTSPGSQFDTSASVQPGGGCPTGVKRDIQGVCLSMAFADVRALCELSQDIGNPFRQPRQDGIQPYVETKWRCLRYGTGKSINIGFSSQVTGRKVIWVAQAINPAIYDGNCRNLVAAVQKEFGLGAESSTYDEDLPGPVVSIKAKSHVWKLEGTARLRAECMQKKEMWEVSTIYTVLLEDLDTAAEYRRQSESAAKNTSQF